MAASPHHPVAMKVAAQHGIPAPIFLGLVQHESGWNPQARSPVGAYGLTQLMPGTARGLGVNLTNPASQLQGGAKYLRQQYDRFGSWKLALAAYNAGPGAVAKYGGVPPYAETQHYVNSILSGAGGTATAPAPAPAGGSVTSTSPATSSAYAQLRHDALQSIAMGSSTPLEALQSLRAGETDTPATSGSTATSGTASPASLVSSSGGKVTLAKGADRAGVSTSKALIAFAKKVSAVAKKALVIGTGTNHSRMTVDGNVSDHWEGDAGDIPATGAELIHLGRSALIAAGADPAWANKQNGGLYNVGSHQVIFNTHQGGDHTNHLHISVDDASSV